MKSRTIISKSMHKAIRTRTAFVGNQPAHFDITKIDVDAAEYSADLTAGKPIKVSVEAAATRTAKDVLQSNKILNAAMFSVSPEKNIIPLRRQFGFVAGESYNRYDLNAEFDEDGVKGKTVWDVLNDATVKDELSKAAAKMFPLKNPLTGQQDVNPSAFYAPLIPIIIATGVLPAQKDGQGYHYFNPEGTVSVGEFLDILNSVKYGSNSASNRRESLDRVSNTADYFNEGYNECLSGFSSPFYRLYTRKELLAPITRLELAYITVLCWGEFTKKYGSVPSGRYELGINVDWNKPARQLSKFEDGFKYKVFKKCRTVGEHKITSYDVKDYLSGMPMSEFKQAIQQGLRGIPLPMFMSLLELDKLDLFYFENLRLDPMKEVSRGEIAYFAVKLAKTFPLPFVSDGDNSYM